MLKDENKLLDFIRLSLFLGDFYFVFFEVPSKKRKR